MKHLLCCICLMAVLDNVLAVDLNPPSWRGQPGSTFQQWDFQFVSEAGGKTTIAECSEVDFIETEQGSQAAPDLVINPYEQTTGICVEFKSLWFITKRLDWLQNYLGRDGVWKLQSQKSFENFLNFIIPNAGIDDNSSTIIQLQFTHNSASGKPDVVVHSPHGMKQAGGKLDVHTKADDNMLPLHWAHSTYLFRLEGCPRYESIFIYAPDDGDIFLDSVTIDTICTKTPDTYLSP